MQLSHFQEVYGAAPKAASKINSEWLTIEAVHRLNVKGSANERADNIRCCESKSKMDAQNNFIETFLKVFLKIDMFV